MPTSSPSFDRMIIPAPCDADWDQMTGNDQVRFCTHCSLHVTNLSHMTRPEAKRLVARSRGRLCVRYIQRSDGSILTRNVPARLHHIGRRVSRIAAGAFTATLSLSSAAAHTGSALNSSTPTQTPPAIELSSAVANDSCLSGTVTDQMGALIPGATVTLTSNHTDARFVSVTGETGAYSFSRLAAGSYMLNAEAPGFARAQSIELQLSGDSKITNDITLEIPEVVAELEISSGDTRIALMGAVAMPEPKDPFINAAFKNDMSAFVELLPTVADINASDEITNTNALAYAVENNNLDMVNVLISAGAGVNSANAYGRTPLMHLDQETSTELLRVLLSAGADVNGQDVSGRTVLMDAAGDCPFEIFEALVKAGAKIDARDNQNNTVLMAAAENEDSRILQFVIKAGVSLNRANEDGETALLMAARAWRSENVEALIEAHAQIKLPKTELDAVLILSSRNDNSRIVKMVLAAGANPNAWDAEKTTALMLAIDAEHVDVAKALIDAGADINAVDDNGWTPLMHANDVECVRLLLNAGADVSPKNKDGQTALAMALKYDQEEIVQLLKSRGAP